MQPSAPSSGAPAPAGDEWPTPSPIGAFADRRRRLRARLDGPALLAAGHPRPINFPSNVHGFRAESHFLYLLGAQLEGALLYLDRDTEVLYAPAPDPDDALWHGASPGPDQLARALGIEVRPLAELGALPAATLPPQCPRAARELSGRLGRAVEPGSGAALQGADAALADALIGLRLVHDEAAVAQLRHAARATSRAHRTGMRVTRPGAREAVAAAAMRAELASRGLGLSYQPIVTVAGEVLHARSSHSLMGEGDLLLADVGAETPEGWAADVTRTWPVSGRFSPSQRDVYAVVLAAQITALDAVRPGVRFLDVHRASQRALLSGLVDLGLFRGSVDALMACHAVSLFYPHGVGHLLGLDVHDLEDLGDRAGYPPGRARGSDPATRYLRLDRDLEPGMAVTIEPGFYVIGELLARLGPDDPRAAALNRDRLAQLSDVRGIRIEDDVLVTETGCEVLSADAPKTIDAVEAACQG